MGWALGTHLTLGGGQGPEKQSLGPQVCPVLFPLVQRYSPYPPEKGLYSLGSETGQSYLFHIVCICLLRAYYEPGTLLRLEDIVEDVTETGLSSGVCILLRQTMGLDKWGWGS